MRMCRVVSRLWVTGWMLSACAQRSAEPAAPASAEDRTAVQAAPAAAPPPPAEAAPKSPAFAPQSLDKSKSADAAQDDEFPNLEAAERALNQAKSDLDRLALAEPAKAIGSDRATASRAEKKDAKRPAASAAGAAPASSAPNLCDNACRTFASLSRAAKAVCRLDGDNGSHCTRAKRVVSDSQSRVNACACQPGQ